ncbi:sensor histidine kinase [Streptomyces sp. NPDC059255]|uniref:sensor histidine kinase n=1 Tax=Streptomyces sp. NPDC059255 TaxID=3346793 RepID=UPI003695AF2E
MTRRNRKRPPDARAPGPGEDVPGRDARAPGTVEGVPVPAERVPGPAEGVPVPAERVPGPAEREFVAFAFRYAHRIRVVVVCSGAVLAVPAMPVDGMPAAAVISAGVIVWSVLHYRLALAGRHPRRILVADLGALGAVCLTQALTIPDSQTRYGSTWVLVVVSIVAVGYQLTHPARLALTTATLLAAVDLAGAVIDRPDGWTYALPNVAWLFVQALLCQGMFRLVLRGSRAADAAGARAAEARRRHDVAQAQRSAEREHLATLHDTACATLLMVSAHGRSLSPDVVRTQAGKDLRRLAAARAPVAAVGASGASASSGASESSAGSGDMSEACAAGPSDLTRELVAELDGHLLSVHAAFDRTTGSLGTVPPPVAVALRGALGEALRNVERHAGVRAVTVTATRATDTDTVTGAVALVVRDEGGGFDPAGVPAHRRGLARSIVERMESAGGRAVIVSRPGEGTTVRLEWPRA